MFVNGFSYSPFEFFVNEKLIVYIHDVKPMLQSSCGFRILVAIAVVCWRRRPSHMSLVPARCLVSLPKIARYPCFLQLLHCALSHIANRCKLGRIQDQAIIGSTVPFYQTTTEFPRGAVPEQYLKRVTNNFIFNCNF